MSRINKDGIKGSLAIVAFILATGFLILGTQFVYTSGLFREGYEIQKEFEDKNEIDFDDPEPLVSWMESIDIVQTDSDPLEIDQSLGIRAVIETKELPKEIVLHIFHEDMSDFFTGTESTDYKYLAEELDRVPSLKYSDMYNVKFDLSEFKNSTKESYTLNGFESITLKKAGTYFASVSVKTQDDLIDHYKSKSSVMEIKDPRDHWIETTLQNLINSAEEQKSDIILSLGVAFWGIGFSIFFSGVNLLLSIKKKSQL